MTSKYQELKEKGYQPILLNGITHDAIRLAQEKLETIGERVTKPVAVMIALDALIQKLDKEPV